MNTIPDTNGDRSCNSRWFHRDEETVIEDDSFWCKECLRVSKLPPPLEEEPPRVE